MSDHSTPDQGPREITAVDNVHELALSDLSLDQLAEQVRRFHLEAEGHIAGALSLFIDCGFVLLEARRRVPNGAWGAWCSAAGVNSSHASRLMRLATYRDQLPAEARLPYVNARGRLNNPSVQRAAKFISDLPRTIPHEDMPRQHPKGVRDTAKAMRSDGASWAEISKFIGVPSTTVREWCDPDAHRALKAKRNERMKEKASARAALREQQKRDERAALARSGSPALAKAYALARQLAASVELATTAAESVDIRSALADAYEAATRSEAAIVRALRAERQDQP